MFLVEVFNMTKDLIVKQAKAEDYEAVWSILVETAEWLKQKGSVQWSGLLDGEDVHNTPEAIERGEVYLAEIDNQPAGMFVLWEKQSEWDKELWGEERTKKYYYLHRITSARSFHGKGVGQQLIAAAKKVAKDDGKEKIRLDCIADNKHLNTFYSENGFKYCTTIQDFKSGDYLFDFNLYELLI